MNSKKALGGILDALAILLVSIAAGTVLMIGVYMLPTGRMLTNVAESYEIIDTEGGSFTWAPGYPGSRLDGFTDNIMLQTAVLEGSGNPIQDAMLNGRMDFPKSQLSPGDALINYVYGARNGEITTYGRYWHGYLVFLKPLLLFFTPSDIRLLNMTVQMILGAVLLALSYRRGGLGLAIPLGAALLSLNPISTALCFQYTDVYLLTLIFGILLLWRRTDEQKFGCLLYLWLGMGLGFFDFLTYPVASLGILLAIELTVSTSGLWKKIQAMLLNSTAWALGYGGMWAGKWVVASAFTDQNVILDALRNISGRTSSTAGEETVDIFSVLWRNAQTYVNVQTLFLLLVLGALLAYLMVVKKYRLRLGASTLVPLVLCALYPVVWYAVLRNHSMIHAYMTHRDLAVTVMALGCAISGSLQKPSPALKVDRA